MGQINSRSLIAAAQKGEEEEAKALLSFGVPTNTSDEKGNSPLHHACFAGNTAVARVLLTNQANPNCVNTAGDTPLILAAFNDSQGCISQLLQFGAKVNFQDADGFTALHYAAGEGHTEIVSMLVESQPSIAETKSRSGLSPVFCAVLNGHPDIVDLLATKCPSCLRSRNLDKDTPLHVACALGQSKSVVNSLLHHGASAAAVNGLGETPIDKVASIQEQTPVSIAIFNLLVKFSNQQHAANSTDKDGPEEESGKETIKGFLRACAKGTTEDVDRYLEKFKANEADEKGFSPIHSAAMNGRADIIKHLIDRGANPNVHTSEQDTPLAMAVLAGSLECIRAMVQNGADVNAVDRFGYSPLHFAMSEGNVEIVSELMRFRVQTNIKTKQGLTPLHCGILLSQPGAVKSLCNFDSSVLRDKNGFGDYPLHMAVVLSTKKAEIMIRTLQESGVMITLVNEGGSTALELARSIQAADRIQSLLAKLEAAELRNLARRESMVESVLAKRSKNVPEVHTNRLNQDESSKSDTDSQMGSARRMPISLLKGSRRSSRALSIDAIAKNRSPKSAPLQSPQVGPKESRAAYPRRPSALLSSDQLLCVAPSSDDEWADRQGADALGISHDNRETSGQQKKQPQAEDQHTSGASSMMSASLKQAQASVQKRLIDMISQEEYQAATDFYVANAQHIPLSANKRAMQLCVQSSNRMIHNFHASTASRNLQNIPSSESHDVHGPEDERRKARTMQACHSLMHALRRPIFEDHQQNYIGRTVHLKNVQCIYAEQQELMKSMPINYVQSTVSLSEAQSLSNIMLLQRAWRQHIARLVADDAYDDYVSNLVKTSILKCALAKRRRDSERAVLAAKAVRYSSAACRIQMALFAKCRRRSRIQSIQEVASVTIGCAARCFLARKSFSNLANQLANAQDAQDRFGSAVTIQCAFRCFLARASNSAFSKNQTACWCPPNSRRCQAAASVIHGSWKCHISRLKIRKYRALRAIIRLQKVARGHISRLQNGTHGVHHYSLISCSPLQVQQERLSRVLQCAARRYIAKRRFFSRLLYLSAQCWARAANKIQMRWIHHHEVREFRRRMQRAEFKLENLSATIICRAVRQMAYKQTKESKLNTAFRIAEERQACFMIVGAFRCYQSRRIMSQFKAKKQACNKNDKILILQRAIRMHNSKCNLKIRLRTVLKLQSVMRGHAARKTINGRIADRSRIWAEAVCDALKCGMDTVLACQKGNNAIGAAVLLPFKQLSAYILPRGLGVADAVSEQLWQALEDQQVSSVKEAVYFVASRLVDIQINSFSAGDVFKQTQRTIAFCNRAVSFAINEMNSKQRVRAKLFQDEAEGIQFCSDMIAVSQLLVDNPCCPDAAKPILKSWTFHSLSKMQQMANNCEDALVSLQQALDAIACVSGAEGQRSAVLLELACLQGVMGYNRPCLKSLHDCISILSELPQDSYWECWESHIPGYDPGTGCAINTANLACLAELSLCTALLNSCSLRQADFASKRASWLLKFSDKSRLWIGKLAASSSVVTRNVLAVFAQKCPEELHEISNSRMQNGIEAEAVWGRFAHAEAAQSQISQSTSPRTAAQPDFAPNRRKQIKDLRTSQFIPTSRTENVLNFLNSGASKIQTHIPDFSAFASRDVLETPTDLRDDSVHYAPRTRPSSATMAARFSSNFPPDRQSEQQMDLPIHERPRSAPPVRASFNGRPKNATTNSTGNASFTSAVPWLLLLPIDEDCLDWDKSTEAAELVRLWREGTKARFFSKMHSLSREIDRIQVSTGSSRQISARNLASLCSVALSAANSCLLSMEVSDCLRLCSTVRRLLSGIPKPGRILSQIGMLSCFIHAAAVYGIGRTAESKEMLEAALFHASLSGSKSAYSAASRGAIKICLSTLLQMDGKPSAASQLAEHGSSEIQSHYSSSDTVTCAYIGSSEHSNNTIAVVDSNPGIFVSSALLARGAAQACLQNPRGGLKDVQTAINVAKASRGCPSSLSTRLDSTLSTIQNMQRHALSPSPAKASRRNAQSRSEHLPAVVQSPIPR